MRLPFIKPADLTAEQKPLYADMKSTIETSFKGFKCMRHDGALIGPWNPWLHFFKHGAPMWNLVKEMYVTATLDKRVREVAVLVTGTHFHAAYALYAHTLMAEHRGLDDDTIATIAAGERPSTLSAAESIAYDAAAALLRGSVLPEPIYKRTVEHFGQEGAAQLFYFVSLYSMISVTLNAFDVPAPE